MRQHRALLVLVFISFLVHLCVIAFVFNREGRVDRYAFNSLDCGEYYAIARNVVHHGRFSQDVESPYSPDTWRTPGYPMFLAGVMLLVGDSPTALIIVQHLAAIASVLLFFKTASRYMSPRRAMIASMIFLLEPYHLFYSFWLLSATFFTLALIVTWWLSERARESASLWHYSMLGLLAGFLVLIWPGAILIPVFVLAGVFVRRPSASTSLHHHIAVSPHKPRLALALIAIACAAPPLAWMTRNKLVAGHFALSHQSGIVLAYFKATEVELWRQGRTGDRYTEVSLNPNSRQLPHCVWDEIDSKLWDRLAGWSAGGADLKWPNLAQGNKTLHDSFEISNALASIGQSMLLESPVSTMVCCIIRAADNITFPLSLALRLSEAVPGNRVKAGALGIIYTLLVVAATIAAFRAWRQWPLMYFPLACIIALALTTTPQVDPRFRVPMIPFLAFLALFPARRAES
jgi:hypothetical protein